MKNLDRFWQGTIYGMEDKDMGREYLTYPYQEEKTGTKYPSGEYMCDGCGITTIIPKDTLLCLKCHEAVTGHTEKTPEDPWELERW